MYLISAVLFLTSENSLKYPLPVPQTQYFLSSLWGYAFWRGLCFLQVAFVCFDFCLLYTYFPQMPDELFAHLYMWDTMEDFSATSSSGWFGFLILGLVGSPRSLPVPRLGPGRGDLGILAVTTQLFTDLPAWMPGLSGCPWLQCSLGRRRGFTAPRRVGREAQGFVCHLTLMFPASPFSSPTIICCRQLLRLSGVCGADGVFVCLHLQLPESSALNFLRSGWLVFIHLLSNFQNLVAVVLPLLLFVWLCLFHLLPF